MSMAIGVLLAYSPANAWNSVGHRVAAQIAYDHLTPHSKKTFNHFNQALNQIYKPESIVNAAVWLDRLRFKDITWFNEIHYIDAYFTNDDSSLPTASHTNALTGIDKASKILLSNRANYFDKGVALRVLIHVIPDIHQPMHAASLVNQVTPDGDMGGNLYEIGQNNVASNLHGFWDEGAGLLKHNKRVTRKHIRTIARGILKDFPCDSFKINDSPKAWADESHHLAKTVAYQIKRRDVPKKEYVEKVQQITRQRLAQSGCRLATYLNQKDKEISLLENKIQQAKH